TECASRQSKKPCPVCGGKLVSPGESLLPAVQAKLHVNPANDVYEREADRIADTLLSSVPSAGQVGKCAVAVQTKPTVRVTNVIQRQVDEDEEIDAVTEEGNEDESLQMDRASGSAVDMGPEQEARVSALRGGGQPLSEEHRSFFEPRFGYDFSRVRVHSDTS